MRHKDENNPARNFIIQRMQEFPSLYSNSYSVLMQCIVENCGDTSWNKEGLIEMKDLDYNKETKTWGPYPKVISEKVAEDLYLHYHGRLISPPHYANGPINDIPYNAHPDWLEEISYFLFAFSKYTAEDVVNIAKMKCFLNYGKYENSYAAEPDRTISNYNSFLKRIPSWQARISEIQYFHHNKKINPDTYLGMHI